MWILFSPSEKKCKTHSKQTSTQAEFYKHFICKDLKNVVESYVRFLQSKSDAEIKKLFGVKNIDLGSLSLAQNCQNEPLLESIIRYSGVAFNALDFESLNKIEQNYLFKKVLIFSNLFGLLRADDKIPFYDLKQGEGFNLGDFSFKTQNFYANNAKEIWAFLAKDSKEKLEFLDLRAGFYQKCFDLQKSEFAVESYTPIFIKNGKILSHYAKFYRGILLKTCAKNNIKNLEQLLNLNIQTLTLNSVKSTQIGNLLNTELVYFVS